MPIEGVFSADEKRAIVVEYVQLAHGQKGRFLAERGLTRSRVGRWRAAYVAGTLDYGLVPRKGAGVEEDPRAAVNSLRAENRALQAKLAASQEELRTSQEVADVLGKAIEILQRSDFKISKDSLDVNKLGDER